jgi:hypothetical protein
MTWSVEYTDEFGDWWERLREAEQESVDAYVQLLETRGPQLPFPYCSGISQSRHAHNGQCRNVMSEGKTRRKSARKRNVHVVPEHFELIFNAVLSSAIVSTRPGMRELRASTKASRIGFFTRLTPAGRQSCC